MAEAPTAGPAFYARRGGRLADWWTLLHPPYTVWHLSYVVLGAAMAPRVDVVALALTLGAFFLGMGIAAHALDELNGRPLRTAIDARVLVGVAVVSLAAAMGLGVVVALRSPVVAVFVPIGALLVPAYNLEWFGGRVHTDVGFACAWGGFPTVVGYVAQHPAATVGGVAAVVLAVGAAVMSSYAQRRLSTPARALRRRTVSVHGDLVGTDGRRTPLAVPTLIAPLESALRALCWAVPLVSVAVLLAHLG